MTIKYSVVVSRERHTQGHLSRWGCSGGGGGGGSSSDGVMVEAGGTDGCTGDHRNLLEEVNY